MKEGITILLSVLWLTAVSYPYWYIIKAIDNTSWMDVYSKIFAVFVSITIGLFVAGIGLKFINKGD